MFGVGGAGVLLFLVNHGVCAQPSSSAVGALWRSVARDGDQESLGGGGSIAAVAKDQAR